MKHAATQMVVVDLCKRCQRLFRLEYIEGKDFTTCDSGALHPNKESFLEALRNYCRLCFQLWVQFGMPTDLDGLHYRVFRQDQKKFLIAFEIDERFEHDAFIGGVDATVYPMDGTPILTHPQADSHKSHKECR